MVGYFVFGYIECVEALVIDLVVTILKNVNEDWSLFLKKAINRSWTMN